MMKTLKTIVFLSSFLFLFVNMTCESNDIPSKTCDETTIIDQNLFQNLESAYFTIIKAEIMDDCLRIEMGASGCDGNTWKFNLVDSGAVAESSPEQRYLKFQLINNEACLAVFKRTVSFDLTPLQINGSNKIILHLDGLEASLNYSY